MFAEARSTGPRFDANLPALWVSWVPQHFPRLALTNPWIFPTLRWCSTMPAVEPRPIKAGKGPAGRTKLRKGPRYRAYRSRFLQLYSYTWSLTPKIADLPMVPQNSTAKSRFRNSLFLLMASTGPWFRRNRSCQIDMSKLHETWLYLSTISPEIDTCHEIWML